MRAPLVWWSAFGLGLLLQTAVLPVLLSDPWRPDFSRLLVLWVALTGVPRGGALLAGATGLALDAASGTPLGFGVLLRLSLYGAARPLRGVFFDDRPFLLLPFAALAALLEDAAAGALPPTGYHSPSSPWRDCWPPPRCLPCSCGAARSKPCTGRAGDW